MRTTKYGAWMLLMIALVTVAAAGCATAPTKAVAVKDLSSLAGTWNGWVKGPAGGSVPATFELAPSGEYVTRAGAFSSQGKAQVKEGAVVLMSTGGSGSLGTTDRTSMASVGQRSDGVLVMKGSGRGDSGPFDFEFTRSK
jgi:hypothetical protein